MTHRGSGVGVFILDFQNACMTIPLAVCEMPFHTSVVPFGVQRGRAPLYPQQPAEGRFLIWRVLGFEATETH